MKYFKKIAGERVYLSPMSMDDAETYARWLNDPEITDNEGVSHYNNTLLNEREWLGKQLLKDKSYYFAVVKNDGDELIGGIGIDNISDVHRTAELLGVYIGEKENRGMGYGTEAVRLMVKYGFGVLNLNNIHLRVYDFNERACRTYAKAGFREYGRRRQAHYFGGKYHDVICMDMLKQEFYGNI